MSLVQEIEVNWNVTRETQFQSLTHGTAGLARQSVRLVMGLTTACIMKSATLISTSQHMWQQFVMGKQLANFAEVAHLTPILALTFINILKFYITVFVSRNLWLAENILY